MTHSNKVNNETQGLSRRQFIKLAGAGAGIIWASRWIGPAQAQPAAEAASGLKILPVRTAPRVIFATGFEEGDPALKLKAHQLASQGPRSGRRCITGVIQQEKQACILEVPLQVQAGRQYKCSFYLRSDGSGTACAVWLADGAGKKIRNIQRLDPVPRRWTLVEASFTAERGGPMQIQIATPTSHNAPPGRVWLDDLAIEEQESDIVWPARVESFPALAAAGGRVWLATLDWQPAGGRRLTVRRFEHGALAAECTLAPEGLTGLAAPAVCAAEGGCVVAVPVERGDRWQIGYAFLGPEARGKVDCRMIECEGAANIAPALAAVGGRACAVWVSNAGAARGIYAAWLTREGAEKAERISDTGANSYNPAIVALADGSLFAAWDSVRGADANIYGAAWRGGKWEAERRLTSDARIERHPALAARGNEVWLAWQAQSYGAAKKKIPTAKDPNSIPPAIRINSLDEQRIAVARLGGAGLEAPKQLFETVSPPDGLLLRPKIGFDGAGRLWLTARRSVGQHAGWEALAWSYEGERWSEPLALLSRPGRWQPAALGAAEAGMVAAVQFDDLPVSEDSDAQFRGEYREWRSGVALRGLPPAEGGRGPARLATEPLRMPETAFSLKEKQALIAAGLPRQKQDFGGKALTLFWGDLHDHTDVSICARATNPPGHDLLANERDIEKLDFCALTDHDYNFDSMQWQYQGEQTRFNHDEGRFVTFLAEEWTSSKNPPAAPSKPVGPGNSQRYGHHNLIFLDPHHKHFYDSYDADITPAMLWEKMEGTEFICIPHELADWQGQGKGNPPTDWSFVDEHLQPVAEIFQARQSYEYFGAPRQSPTGAPFPGLYYMQDAWARKIIIGVIASPDHGGGMGKVGVWAERLDRESLFAALRARHTYGTSGAKMGLFFRAGAAMMGDKVARPEGPLTFEVRATALREIKEVVIFRNNKVAFRTEPNQKEVRLEWKEEQMPQEKLVWYYARIHAVDNELAWSSPIWFEGKK